MCSLYCRLGISYAKYVLLSTDVYTSSYTNINICVYMRLIMHNIYIYPANITHHNSRVN